MSATAESRPPEALPAAGHNRSEPLGAASHHRSEPLGDRFALGAIVVVLVIGTLIARRRGYYGLGGNTIVRCRDGHLFTTICVPGASVKAIRLGWARFQHCPVGQHWTLVTPAKESELTEDQRRSAEERRDVRLP